MQLYFIRHGETYANQQGIVEGQRGGMLTNHGREQVEKTAIALSGIYTDMIWSSDLKRARQTATAIGNFHTDTQVQYEERLRERSLGIYEGGKPERYFEYVKKYFEKNPKGTFFQVPIAQGETLSQVQKRIVTFVEDLWVRYFGKTMFVVTHGAILRLLVMHLKQMPQEHYYDESVKFKNCSITVISFDKRKVPLFERMNDVSHLGKDSLKQEI